MGQSARAGLFGNTTAEKRPCDAKLVDVDLAYLAEMVATRTVAEVRKDYSELLC